MDYVMNENHNKVLAVIPARRGSKRLPKKNILPCGGKPLIAHSIYAANQATKLTDIIFSTDDEEIRTIAKEHGAYAPFLRPKKLATDNITNKDVLLHALDWMESERNIQYDYVVLLQPTAPLRTAEHIDKAIDIVIASEYPTLASVSGPHKKRHQIIKKPLDKNAATNFTNLKHEEFYLFNASIYIASRDHLIKHDSLFSDPHSVFVSNDLHVDVDNELDLKLADLIISNKELL